MVDIQSPTAEIRRGKKKERKKIEITVQKYNGLLLILQTISSLNINKVHAFHICQVIKQASKPLDYDY